MNPLTISYLTFGVVVLAAVAFDLGLFSKSESVMTIKRALFLTCFWVLMALGFFAFLWMVDGQKVALEYLSAYMMEWSLSIDNIFVFILIFSFFGVKEQYYGNVLLIGILLAIALRMVFISVGIILVTKFHWILYLFGVILVYTGIRMFFAKRGQTTNLQENRVYRWMKQVLPLTAADGAGKFRIQVDGKTYYTSIFVVVVLLATTDIVFAVDSIPAVFGVSQNLLVIYTSNVFAVLGLRSLFFLVKGAAAKFSHLPQGISAVLVFIGLKMLAEPFGVKLPITTSLLVIVGCLAVAMLYSVFRSARDNRGQSNMMSSEIRD
jgi:tellurite resistance protein TerC